VLGLAADAGTNYVDLLYVEEDYWAAFGSVYRARRDKLVAAAHWSSGPVWDLDYCRRTFENVLANVGNDHVEVALMTMIDEKPRRGQWLETSLEHPQSGTIKPCWAACATSWPASARTANTACLVPKGSRSGG
jgi:hypothetical protein